MDDIIAQKYAGSKLLKAVWLLLYFVIPAAQGKNMGEICNRRPAASVYHKKEQLCREERSAMRGELRRKKTGLCEQAGFPYISCRPSKARMRVASSANSRWLPTGMP